MQLKTIILPLIILMLLASYAFAQESNKLSQQIDSLIKITHPTSFNGVILIKKKGKTIYSGAYGYRNLKTKVPLKTEDQFEIMSNSKQITAVLLLKEVEKGKVSLQSPIKNYLPFLTETWADSVTVHQLLNHTHGIIDIEKPLAFRPGTDFLYGNLSNILLGKIIENVSHKSYRSLANALFQSLKMKNTFCYFPDNKRTVVYGHMKKSDTFEMVEKSFINDDNLPADGIITNAEDLSIWNAKLHNGKILQSGTYKLMTTESAQSQHNVFGKEKTGYGYNIRIAEENGIKYLGHTGLGDGFSSLNIYIPKSDISIVILENQMNENSDLYYFFETGIKELVMKSDLVK